MRSIGRIDVQLPAGPVARSRSSVPDARADTLLHQGQGQGRGIDNASPVVPLTARAGLSKALPYLNSIAVDEYRMMAKIAD